MSLLKLSSSIIYVEHSKRGYNVTLSRNKLVLFFSQEHCINYQIKNISTGSHNTFSANYPSAVTRDWIAVGASAFLLHIITD